MENLRVACWLWARAEQQDHRQRHWRAAEGGRDARACEEMRQGGFICPVGRRGGFTSPSWPTGAPAWARGSRDVRWSRRPMENGGSPTGECAQAAWHWPKLPTRVTSPRCTVASTRVSDRWVLWCLGVRAWPGYGAADVAGARHDVARGYAQFENRLT
jgi:hypothetical protein